MAFAIDLNTQPSSEEIHSFDTHIDMDDINICNSSSNSATETECTTEVIIHPTISDEEIPKVGMLFGTLEEARQFYYNYANKVGFEPHIRNTNFHKNGKTPINQSIQCNRDGYRTKKNPVTHRSNTVSSVHCKARIYVKLDIELEKWILSKALADEAGGRSNLKFLEKDVRNYISGKLRINGDDTDAQEMLDYFTRMKEQNPNFFYDICLYSDNSLKHAFWADARSRAAYEYFGDVVSFDTTYKLNKYEMPVAAFVGVNHHGRSCLFGCALLGNEETESFEWLMQTFIKYKLGKLSRYEEIKATMHGIIWESHSRESFESSWYDFIEEYTLHDNNWLNDIYHIRNIWVPVFLEHEFWAGMRSTQRSESMHSFFDKYLMCRSSLVQFVHQYDNCLADKEQQELECDAADNRGLIPCVSNSPIEKQFQYEYTNNIFRNWLLILIGHD
ncbi:hypothetical protein Ahy_A03g010770 [Arachis hypogaea]|uniref:Protein FAR1-RELATED SEQUENCE n=1 Tax=Arachis hypogaea TaxID=3818 RepID=A0A445DNF5_ARAHY|nr:hypothetical protein Ahy_A03g010770 [Arachis hypogaea]